jgi:hypothetical protein
MYGSLALIFIAITAEAGVVIKSVLIAHYSFHLFAGLEAV